MKPYRTPTELEAELATMREAVERNRLTRAPLHCYIKRRGRDAPAHVCPECEGKV